MHVRKTNDEHNDALHYFVKMYRTHNQMKEFVFEYVGGNFEIRHGNANDREKELLNHFIHALELSTPFSDSIFAD